MNTYWIWVLRISLLLMVSGIVMFFVGLRKHLKGEQ